MAVILNPLWEQTVLDCSATLPRLIFLSSLNKHEKPLAAVRCADKDELIFDQTEPSLRGVQSFNPSVVADTVRCVPQVVAPVVNPLSCHFVTQVSLQFMLSSSVRPAPHTQKKHKPT